MRLQHSRRAGAAVATVVAAVLALLLPPHAAHASPAAPALTEVSTDQPEAQLRDALRRDLGLGLGLEGTDTLSWSADAHAAAGTAQRLQASLGTGFAGAWLADDGRLVIGVTDLTVADQVRAAGAQPRLVHYSARQLRTAKAALDRTDPPPASVTGWYVDVAANRVVVEARPQARDAAVGFVAASGVSAEAVRIETTTASPRPLSYPLREGDPFYVGNAMCTIGFLIRTAGGATGYVTAGHCGATGATTRGFNLEPQGTFRASVFPGRDAAVVLVNSDWAPQPRFAGSSEAPIGATVCKIGAVSGYTCGVITAKNQTVNYPQGAVFGLTRTTMCAMPGDSGAPVFAGDQAQGTVSGGSGNCTTGGVTYFQPLNPVLSTWGLSLITR